MNLAKLSLGASVPTETFLNIIAVFDSIYEPFVGGTIQKYDLGAEFSDRSILCYCELTVS